ncbi:MAG: LPS export ABC transporter periplasmic protein LptC [Cryomorphaceae bacterium]
MNPSTTYRLFIPAMLLAGMFVSGCVTDLEEVQRVTSYGKLPLQTIRNSRIVYTDSGKTSFVIEAGRIERYPNQEQPIDEFSEGIKVTSYNFYGDIESELTAERATNYTDENIMVAKDSVILMNKEGKMLNTEELTWNEKEGKIYTDKFVKITTLTEILYGDGLEAEEDFSSYEIKNIKGRITIDQEEDSTQVETPIE